MTAPRKRLITKRSIYTFKSEAFVFCPSTEATVLKQDADEQAHLLVMLMMRAIPERVMSRFCELIGANLDDILEVDFGLTTIKTKPHRNAGETHGANILKESQVHHIRKMKGIARQADLAEQYKVSTTTISDIWRGKTWTHLLESDESVDTDKDIEYTDPCMNSLYPHCSGKGLSYK